MPEQKSVRTFILCDKEGNKHEINEFLIAAELKSKELVTKPTILTKHYFETTSKELVEYTNKRYYLQKDNTEIELYDCEPSE